MPGPSHRPGRKPGGEAAAGDGTVLAPMPGAVILVECRQGQPVKRGQRLLVLEAMKMEYIWWRRSTAP